MSLAIAVEPSRAAQGNPAGGLCVGAIALRNRVLLAPMSGVSDLPFRMLAHRLGAGVVVTEMVASRELVRERRDVVRRMAADRTITPHVVQLAGCEAQWMAEGARIAEAQGADAIDINMGCPARLVTGKQSGSALMRDLDHALALIEATVGAVKVPVTLKMRMGWDARSLNAAELARRAQAAGIRMLTVHARTRNQFFTGTADWPFIASVKAAVTIPVIANGDIITIAGAKRALELSGADGIMIGRGAYGAPWLPGRIAQVLAGRPDPGEPALVEQGRIVIQHYQDMLSHYGRELGRRNARKHLGWYVARASICAQAALRWRKTLCAEDSPEKVQAALRAFYDTAAERAA